MQSLTAVVLGATGLVGEQLIKQLLDDPVFSKVRILVRRPVKLSHSKLETEILNFDNLVEYRQKLGEGDCMFCCIGTTNQKVRGDKKMYRKIDLEIPLNAAKMGKTSGFTKYLLVSAVGADVHSKNFYLKLKGEVEREIASINFDSFHVFRPSMLFGKRKEFRLLESFGKRVMKSISGLFMGSLKRFKGIDAAEVARAMVTAAKSDAKGMFTHHYDDMRNAGIY